MNIDTMSWWALTKRILFSPTMFFAQLPDRITYRTSALYLAKTALLAALIHAFLLSLVFYIIVACFVSIFSAFVVIFGTLLTPLIAVAGSMPPEKVPAALADFAKNGGMGVVVLSLKLAAFLLVSVFGTIVVGTCALAGTAHGIARMLGGTGNFSATAAAYAFGSAVWVLSTVPIVNALSPIYAAVLAFLGIRRAHNLSNGKALLVVALSGLVPILAFVLYSLMSAH